MGIVPVVAFNNQLCMIGNLKTWISNDGKKWTPHNKTDWGERFGMTITYFNGKLWAMGGMKTWDKFFNDIWVSQDGISWRLIKSHAEWSERRGHNVVVFNNKLWLMGGSKSTGIANKPPTESFNDVWSSQNGLNWTLELLNAKWTKREPQVIVYNNQLFLIGNKEKSDVWTSIDGKERVLLTESCEWNPRQNYGLLVYDNKIWIFGGRVFNDVWNSNSGKVGKNNKMHHGLHELLRSVSFIWERYGFIVAKPVVKTVGKVTYGL